MTRRTLARAGRSLSTAVSVVMLLVAGGSIASAQITRATLSGAVRDETGAVLPGVTVGVVNLDTGAKRSIVTDSAGAFVLPGLPSGRYSTTATLSGFDTDVRTGIQLAVGQQASIVLTLRLAGTSETVQVVASAQLVDTRSSSLSALVEEQQIEELPLNGRNFVDLALLQPGVSAFRERQTGGLSGRGQQININGAPGRSNSYLLDGANMKSYHGVAVSTAADTTLGVDTVAEFRVVTNAFSADYGRAMGGVINIITKSGSNDVNGSVFEFYRNSKMDARNFFDRGAPPPFQRNQFGGTIGAPIRRNRTFAFAGVEGLIERLTSTQATTVPTAEVRTGAFGPIAPSVRPYLDLFPLPNGPGLGGGLARYSFPFNRDTDELFFQSRVDHHFSQKDSMFVRYTFDDATRALPTSYPAFSNLQTSRSQWYTAESQRVFSERLLNSARFSYSRLRLTLDLQNDVGPEFAFIQGQPTMGQISVGGMPSLGPDSTNPQLANTDYLTFTDDLSYTLGRHFLKSGVLVERAVNNILISTAVRGNFTFPTLQRFLAGEAATFSGVMPGSEVVRSRRNTVVGAYLQDDYSVSSRLTLNLGVRYEMFTVPRDSKGRDSALRDLLNDTQFTVGPLFENPSLGNIGPRIGMAWDVAGNGRTSVRGGGGLYFDTDGVFNSAQLIGTFAEPFASQTTLVNPAFPRPTLQGGARSRTARTLDYHVEQPQMWTYNVNVQREMRGRLGLLAGYAGSRGAGLVRAVEGNPVVPVIQAGGSKFFPAGGVRRNRAWGPIDLRTTGSKSWYDALQVALNRRFSNGYQFQVSYTMARTTDLTQGQLNLDTANSPVHASDPYDPEIERGRADFDVRHIFTFNFVWQLPVGQSLTGGAALLGKGWQINGLGTFRSGLPYSPAITTNWSRSGNQFGQDRPNLKPGADPKAIIGTVDRWFDPSMFELQPAGYLGNAGRNILQGPGFANLDLALVKRQGFRAFGGGEIEVRLEVFNVMNRANFGTPNRVIFGGAREGEAPLTTAGVITRTVNDARQLQLGVKMRF